VWREGKKLAQVARLQASGQLHIPSAHDDPEQEIDEALAAFGLQAEVSEGAPPQDKCYLWPCNVGTFNIWQRLRTQWRTGGTGAATGLDYSGVIDYLRQVAGIKQKALPEIFSCIQAMELETLHEWEKRG
jgi:hypothetical protein